MTTLPYTITGTSGDRAEAIDEASATTAARTLVDDGNERADVHGPTGKWILSARRAGNGSIALQVIQPGTRAAR